MRTTLVFITTNKEDIRYKTIFSIERPVLGYCRLLVYKCKETAKLSINCSVNNKRYNKVTADEYKTIDDDGMHHVVVAHVSVGNRDTIYHYTSNMSVYEDDTYVSVDRK